jgi:hypothetical protein
MENRLFKTDTAPVLNEYNSIFHQNNEPVPHGETVLLLVCDLHVVFIWVDHIWMQNTKQLSDSTVL